MSTRMASYRIWRELWRLLCDLVTGKYRDEEAEGRERARLRRLRRQEERRQMWEREKKRKP